ncbi:hypothetical protein MASR2M74_26250 [Paracoccaceae bacterium]
MGRTIQREDRMLSHIAAGVIGALVGAGLIILWADKVAPSVPGDGLDKASRRGFRDRLP